MFNQLCIDTERKVWKKRLRLESTGFQSIYIDQGTIGRGNNWAHGFFNNDNIEETMNIYRKLAESSFEYQGCMLLHSLAGGTGSGLGSRLVQEIRDDYPKGSILTASFAPFRSGETSVQNYNALLSLDVLQQCSDMIGYFSNDNLMRCVARTQSQSTLDKVKLSSLNQYAARCLGGFLIPVTEVHQENNKVEFSKQIRRFDPLDFIYNLTPAPAYKYCQFATSSVIDKNANRDTWEDVMSELLRNIPHNENRMYIVIELDVFLQN